MLPVYDLEEGEVPPEYVVVGQDGVARFDIRLFFKYRRRCLKISAVGSKGGRPGVSKRNGARAR